MKKYLMAIFFGSALVLGACGEEEADFTDADELDEEPVEEEPIEDVDEVIEDETEVEEAPEDEQAVENAEEDLITTADAEQIVQQNCTSCHGADLAGAGSIPALNDVGSRLTAHEIVEVIEEGPGAMPAHIVTGEEAAAVAEYLSNLQ